MDPVITLQRIAYLLERQHAPRYRSRAFRRAAERVRELGLDEVQRRIAEGTLLETPDIGPATAEVILESLQQGTPAYLAKLEATFATSDPAPVAALRKRLKGDCHTHTDWSDGRTSLEAMADAAKGVGHEYLAITDHSPRLKVARGLTAERLRQQIDRIEELNSELAPFRILTGIEVDILDDGSLDQESELLERLDIVVASVHSKLRMPEGPMTERMIKAIQNPNTDIIGHITGRIIVGRGRPESAFDAERVFRACAAHDKAIEINARPERLDPPRRLLRLANEVGCLFSVNTDAHSPGQLEWQEYGCERAVECGVDAERMVNGWSTGGLLGWTERHGR